MFHAMVLPDNDLRPLSAGKLVPCDPGFDLTPFLARLIPFFLRIWSNKGEGAKARCTENVSCDEARTAGVGYRGRTHIRSVQTVQ